MYLKKSVMIDKEELPISIEFRDRKTIGIHIRSISEVKMFVPKGTPEEIIEEILKKKETWIKNKIEEIKKYPQIAMKSKEFQDGDSFLFLGKKYSLVVKHDPIIVENWVRISYDNIIVGISIKEKEIIKYTLEKWYREKAKKIFGYKTIYYGQLLGRLPNRIRIKDQKTRWGSCSSKGNINYNWRVIMAPETVVDYIVVHELCHLIHMNHSKDFWNLVQSILPDYKESRSWLQQNGTQLIL